VVVVVVVVVVLVVVLMQVSCHLRQPASEDGV